ncbi:MAG: endonuclease domain-containing protein [Clostridia bacterium]|nr:endonuclease domain-containing protein [Clostridia bacterium]
MYKHNEKLVTNAQNLRKNMTDEEKHLWYDFLKNLPVTVNRQKNIGNYIVDFLISSSKLVIELDGSQHWNEENKENDKKREEYLEKKGLEILRYSNKEINENFEGVCADILKHIKQ